MFQSSPVPGDGCNQTSLHRYLIAMKCFNPHPSRGTGATEGTLSSTRRPEVSILTRPGGRVQRESPHRDSDAGRFQSSPVPGDGCNHSRGVPSMMLGGFQSSPVPGDGCNIRSAYRLHARQRCFNPHPSRGTGATRGTTDNPAHHDGFNPHPSRGTGATPSIGTVLVAVVGFNPHPSRGTGATPYNRTKFDTQV